MKVKCSGYVWEKVGEYSIHGKQGYVLLRKEGVNEKLENALSEFCVPVVTVADMVPGRKYKVSSDKDTHLCVDIGNCMGVTFATGHKYAINCRTGVINCWINSNCEIEEVP
jgi:hypothetical protein